MHRNHGACERDRSRERTAAAFTTEHGGHGLIQALSRPEGSRISAPVLPPTAEPRPRGDSKEQDQQQTTETELKKNRHGTEQQHQQNATANANSKNEGIFATAPLLTRRAPT
jgi:hypothetical protein